MITLPPRLENDLRSLFRYIQLQILKCLLCQFFWKDLGTSVKNSHWIVKEYKAGALDEVPAFQIYKSSRISMHKSENTPTFTKDERKVCFIWASTYIHRKNP
jgi:hypothetical protein